MKASKKALVIFVTAVAILFFRGQLDFLVARCLYQTNPYDVVVYSGTPSGVLAAVAASRNGANVLLLEPTNHVGGIISNGLGGTDIRDASLITGLAKEFFQRVGEAYGKNRAVWRMEPHVAESVFASMLEEASVEVRYGWSLDKVFKESNKIIALDSDEQGMVAGIAFIDASYEGDLLAKAGVSYALGREGRSVYGESFAGVLAEESRYQFEIPVSAYDEQGLLPGIVSRTPPPPGTGDHRLMAYNYRFCITKQPGKKTAFSKPNHYNPRNYEILGRYLAEKQHYRLVDVVTPLKIPNKKFDINSRGTISTNLVGGSYAYPEASTEERERIRLQHELWARGFIWFLLTDERTPPVVKEQLSLFGLCNDEYTDNENWPRQLYVREARRMLGRYVMTQKDVTTATIKDDAIAVGEWPIETHHAQRYVDKDGFVKNEGYLFTKKNDEQIRYDVPFRALLPKKSEAANLLVPVAMSSSRIAFSSLRVEPLFMATGPIAGIAASEFKNIGDFSELNSAELRNKANSLGS